MSVARTRKLCDPSASVGVVNGDVHVVKAAESSEHWKVEPSFAVKLNIATALVDGFVGVEENVVSGATVSIIQV